jgi:parallel beta-helix repeat protein
MNINTTIKKTLVLGIVLLFVGASIVPSFGKNVEMKDDIENEYMHSEKTPRQFPSSSMFFTKNNGQFPAEVLFQTHASDATVYLCTNHIVSVFTRTSEESRDAEQGKLQVCGNIQPPQMEISSVVATFLDTNTEVSLLGEEILPHRTNYFLGNDESHWYTNVPNYQSILYKNIYSGINLRYYYHEGSLKYDFIVSPGADPSLIRIRYDGARDIQINENKVLVSTNAGSLIEQAPVIYQEIHGMKQQILGQFILSEPSTIGFDITAAYNHDLPLIIDPAVVYSTYLGGGGNDRGYGIAADTEGNAYVAGETTSNNFPTINPYDDTANGDYDIFVSKFAADGITLLYSTYLGGTGYDNAVDIAVDDTGNAYVIGTTHSTNYPLMNPYDNTPADLDVVVTTLSATGDTLLYSTYLGGTQREQAKGLTIDSEYHIYATGITYSSDFPTVNAYDSTYSGEDHYADTFVTKFSTDGTSLLYSTYLGGSSYDASEGGIVVDMNNCAYIAGETASTDFPTVNAYDNTFNGHDAFVTKFSATGDSLVYSTFLGGSSSEVGRGIAIDAGGQAYVTGQTLSSNFPRVNAYDSSYNGNWDVFVTKFSTAGNTLVYSTFLGGTNEDIGYGITVNDHGNATVTGTTKSVNFPTVNPYDGTHNNGIDVFVSQFSSAGNILLYSTYLGGARDDYCYDVLCDNNENIFLTGKTNSVDFPLVTPYDDTLSGTDDAFVAKITFAYENQPPFTPSNPIPSNGAIDVELETDVSWIGGDPNQGDTVIYDVYFGTNTSPPKVAGNLIVPTYDPGLLSISTRYYWKIVSHDSYGAITLGPLWTFSTIEEPNRPPYLPSDPYPENEAENVSVYADLRWTGGDPDPLDTVTCDIYFGTVTPPPKIVSNQTTTTYTLGMLNDDTTYYWQIVAWDNHGVATEGSLWSFTTNDLFNIVYVDDDYNASTPGWGTDHFNHIAESMMRVEVNGTVYVYSGTYYENLEINKTLRLIGEDKNTTVIDGGSTDITVYVIADYVTVSGFTVQHAGGQYEGEGFLVYEANYTTITGNIVTNNPDRNIVLSEASHNLIAGNVITNCPGYGGIQLHGNSWDNTITENLIIDNRCGVWICCAYGTASFYHNNFINNTVRPEDDSSYPERHYWDNGYPSGGNFWDDYTGIDQYSGPGQNESGSDGIGDTPYNITQYGYPVDHDYYPLMNPWGTEIPNIDPDASYLTLTDTNMPGLPTCPAGDGPVYQYLTVTCLNENSTPLSGIPAEYFEFLVTATQNTHYYGTLSCTFTAVDPETDENGEIRFTIQGDTSIVRDIDIQVCIFHILLNDVATLSCKSVDYYPCNGAVDLADFTVFGQDYGTTHWRSDFTWDGRVSLSDFVLFGQHYGHHY